jgi:hypothetical protein
MTTSAPPRDRAIEQIDSFLSSISHQSIVAQADVADFALDLRQTLSSVTPEAYNDK